MSFPEFGEIVEDTPSFQEFGEIVEQPEFSPGTAALKGIAKGTYTLSQASPFSGVGPFSEEQIGKLFEKFLPTSETSTEKGLERIGEAIPGAAGGGVGGIIRAILGGASAQALEEVGAPKWAQNLAELAAFTGPGLGKKLIPKASQKEAVEFLRKKGLSDKAITPLLKSEKQLRRLGKFAHKGERVGERLREAHEKLGSGYSELKEIGKNLELPRNKVTAFSSALENKLDDLSPDFQKLVSDNVNDLLSKPVSARSLIDFWQDINNKMSKGAREGIKGGREVLGILKEPLKNAFKDIDSAAAKDFEMLNEFYSKKQRAFAILKPKNLDHAIDIAEAAGIFGSIATGDLNKLEKILTLAGGRALATEMLINPRLQNLSNQMLNALGTDKLAKFNRISQEFLKELEKTSPDISQEIKKKLSTESRNTT